MITCSDIPVRNLWRVAYSFCTDVRLLSEPKKRHQDCLMLTAHLLHGLYMVAIGNALTYLWFFWECTQHPGTSLHVISFTRLPCISTASNN